MTRNALKWVINNSNSIAYSCEYDDDQVSGVKNDNNTEPKYKRVSTLIMPLKREKYRNQIMPSKISADYVTPHKCVSASGKKQVFDLETHKEESQKDNKIMNLELKVSDLQKENMDLRVKLNYFMQLWFSQNM